MMELMAPQKIYAESWKEALVEFEQEGVTGFWNIPAKPTQFEDYLRRIKAHAQGLNLPPYWVPATTFWLIDQKKFIGHVNVRHQLNERMEKRGGHIGYAIRPSERKKGYGTKILELALKEAKKLGLDRVLITCDWLNTASKKVIEANGGVLQNMIDVKGEHVRRYWIKL